MVRLPSAEAGDVDAVRGYIDDRQFDGCWLPCLPHAPAGQVVQGWLDAWAASQPGVRTVELRIGQEHTASQHVAVNAGFIAAGTVTQFVPGTGNSFYDLRYVLEQPETLA